MKRRNLSLKQQVIIIYKKTLGFVQETAEFRKYQEIEVNNTPHQIPVFMNSDGEEFTGLDCFWVLPDDIRGRYTIERFQQEAIALQLKVLEMAAYLNYSMPNKFGDPKMEKAALHKSAVVEKLGFDPRDETWMESELAITERERKWFKFEREKGVAFYQLMYTDDWDGITQLFNSEYKDDITVEQARKLSVKRMRYAMGSTPTRMSGNRDKETWKKTARDFEETHRKIDERMSQWSESRNNNFPLVKTKQPISFSHGAHFNACIEKIPQYFTDTKCTHIKEGSVLRVVSYDPEKHYIRLDFPKEVRSKLKPEETADAKPWIPKGADYVFWVDRNKIKESLEFVEKL